MASSQTTASPRAGTSTAVPRAHATTPFQRPLRFVVRTCCRPLSFSTLAEELPSHHRIRPSLGRHDPPRSVVIARLIRAVARPPPAALLQPAAQRSCRPPCRLPRHKPPWRACMRRPVPHGHIRLRDHRIRSQQCRISTLHRGDGSPA